MDAEILGISRINTMVSRCPHLKAFLTANDKTPFTDGHIDMYNGLSRSNHEWRGRVDVQVKARSRALSKKAPAYSMPKTALAAFRELSGVLYFVVTVDAKSGKTRPYYALLSPFTIEHLLTSTPEEYDEVSVPLKPFPNDPQAIERIVALAHQSHAQNPATGFDSALMERFESITIYASSDLDFSAPIELRPGEIDYALELRTVDNMIVPLDGALHIYPPEYTAREVAVQTTSGEITYESMTVRRTSRNSIEARLSSSLAFVFSNVPGNERTNVTVTLEPTLAGRCKSLEFFAALLETRSFTIDGRRSHLDVTSQKEFSDLYDHLKTLRALTELFLLLGVDTRLVDLDEMNENQYKQLNLLHRVMIQGEELHDPIGEVSRVMQFVGRSKLMLMLVPGKDPMSWTYVDPFEIDKRRQFRWRATSGQSEIPVTAYEIIEPEHLPTALNMKLDWVVGAYEAIAEYETTYRVANERVLALILAADADGPQSDKLLAAAERLNEWLVSEQGPEPHHLVNRWQIIARNGGLSKEQRSAVRKLRREASSKNTDEAMLLALSCAVLLADAEEVQDLLANIPEESSELLRTWPIWSLFKRTQGDMSTFS